MVPKPRNQPKKLRYVGRRFAIRNVFFFLLLVVAAYFFFNSAFFNVTRLEVQGQKTLAPDQIIRLSGAEKGANIFKVNTAELEDRISMHPSVAEVNVKRDFPRTLVFTVRERTPCALVPSQGGFIEVCGEGYYLNYTEVIGDLELPIISGVKIGSSAAPGSQISDSSLRTALEIIACFGTHRSMVAEIDVHPGEQIKVFTQNGPVILLGSADQLNDKVQLALEIVDEVTKTVDYIDVRFPKSPVVK